MLNFEIIILILPLLIVALTIHEFAHAYTADRLGDPTPRSLGRVTLNPLKHLDPMGTALLVFTLIFTPFAFGWAKPVVFNPMNLKNPKTDTGLVALAGPLSNIAMVIIAAFILTTFQNQLGELGFVLIRQFIILNVVLATFNLIPIYPLDGFNIAMSYLPDNLSRDFAQTAQYGQWVLLVLIVTGATSNIIRPVVEFTLNLLNTFI